MCLKDVSLQLYTLQLKGRWGVCLAATPKDCHKPINTTPASTSPPTQMMSAFIRRVVIPPLVGCEAAAVLLFVSAPEKPERRRVSSGSPPHHHHHHPPTGRSERSNQKLSCVLHAHAHFANSGKAFFLFSFFLVQNAKRGNAALSTIGKLSPLLQLLWLQDFFYKVSVPLHPSNPFLDFLTTRITLSLNAAGINRESENQV